MNLNSAQRRFLKGRAHALDPVVHIGKQGVTEAVLGEISRALDAHELIKVQFRDFKEQKKELSARMAEHLGAQCVGIIGHLGIFYRQNHNPEARKFRLP